MADRLRNAQRHERLKELLTQKVEKMLVAGGGSRAALNDAQREFVNQEVDLMLHSGDASEKSLNRLVAQIRVLTPSGGDPSGGFKKGGGYAGSHDGSSSVLAAQKYTKRSKSETGSRASGIQPTAAQIANAAVRNYGKNHSGGDGGAQQHSSNHKHGKTFNEASIPEHSPSRKDQLSALRDHDMWAKMCQKDQEAFFRERALEKKVSKQKAEEQRLFLDQQVNLRKSKKVAAIEEEKVFVKHEQQQLEIWKSEEEKEVARRKQRFEEERRIRDEQLEATRKRKLQEAQVLKQEDVEQAKKIKEEYAKEQQQNEARKIKAKEDVAKFYEYNASFKDRKKQQIEREMEMDREHQRQFLERLEKQEQEREDNLLKMHERQKRQFVMATRIQNTMAEKSKEDEEKAKAYLDRVHAEREAAKKAKEDKEKEEKVKLRQYLTLQIMAKEKEQAKRKAQLEDQKAQVKRELEESERREAERRISEKQKALKHRAEIEAQIVEHSHRRNVIMTETEMRINAKKLDA